MSRTRSVSRAALSALSCVFLLADDSPPSKRTLRDWIRGAGTRYDTVRMFADGSDPVFRPKEGFTNDPSDIGFDIQRKWDALLRKGQSDPIPFPGHWWPMEKDGVAASWESGEPSPLEKYTKAYGLDAAAVEWEKTRHGSQSRGVEGWWGHCNGWSASALCEPEPTRAVTVNGVTFQPADQAALLAEAYWDCIATGVDTREEATELPTDNYGRYKDPAARDINPGALFLLATNVIGRHRRAFILDINPGQQVWNYPVYAFEVTTAEPVDAATAMQHIAGRECGAQYAFNPAARAWLYAEIALSHVSFCPPEAIPALNDVESKYTQTLVCTFVLELDAEGNVIGGEWTGQCKLKHPDFAWACFGPYEGYSLSSDGRYIRYRARQGNPYVQYADVRKLTGVEPSSPTLPSLPPAVTRVVAVADSQLAQGQASQAVQTYSQLLSDGKHDPEVLMRRGWAYFLDGKLDEALKDYDEALTALSDPDPGYVARRCLALAAKGGKEDRMQALVDAGQLVKKSPKSGWGYCARGWVHFAEGHFDQAQADFQEALARREDPFFRVSLQSALGRLGRLGRLGQGSQQQGQRMQRKAFGQDSKALETVEGL